MLAPGAASARAIAATATTTTLFNDLNRFTALTLFLCLYS